MRKLLPLLFIAALFLGCETSERTISVTGVTLYPNTMELRIYEWGSESRHLSATVLPYNATNQSVTWTSNNHDVVTVNDWGELTAVSPGTATITVTTDDGGRTARATVTVTQAIRDLLLSNHQVILSIGETETLIATAYPANATIQNLIWSSDNPSVATVDDNGVVTAISEGRTNVRVSTGCNNNIWTQALVTVNIPTIPVTGITMDRTAIPLLVGHRETLIATVTPADATNQNVTWSSSNPSIVSVNNIWWGQITAVSVGTATITATTDDGGFTASSTITVPCVTLNNTGVTLYIGNTETLIATAYPAHQNLKWESDTPSVATVDANGVVTAVSEGWANITVTTEYGATTTAWVWVNTPRVLVTGITLCHSVIEIHRGVDGTVFSLTATVYPANATNQNVLWSSSNPSVVDVLTEWGLAGSMRAVSLGTAIITVTTECGNFTASSTVTVVTPPYIPTPVTGVGFGFVRSPMFIGEQISRGEFFGCTQIRDRATLFAIIEPSHATNRTVMWTSSNPSVATIDARGEITALSVGTTTITVTTEDGAHTATTTISVEEFYLPTSLEGVVINGVRWATRNLSGHAFASSPADIGLHYQWNRPRGWFVPNNISVVSGWDSSYPTGTRWYAENDPCPPGWRVPNSEEGMLLHQVWPRRTEVRFNNAYGWLVGTSPNLIFLPRGENVWHNGEVMRESRAGYWTSTLRGPISPFLILGDGAHTNWGALIRCVADE